MNLHLNTPPRAYPPVDNSKVAKEQAAVKALAFLFPAKKEDKRG